MVQLFLGTNVPRLCYERIVPEKKEKWTMFYSAHYRIIAKFFSCQILKFNIIRIKVSRIRLGTHANLGKKCALDHSVDLTPQVPCRVVITAMHCLASLKILDVG